MIGINLLPEQYRTKERMPLPAFAALLAGVISLAGTASFFLYVQFGTLATVRAEKAQMEEELAGYKSALDYHGQLTAEGAGYEKREAKISEIASSRIVWTRKLDELADIVNHGEDIDRYMVWFDNMEVDQLARTPGVKNKNKDGGLVRLSGRSGSANYANMANFFEDVALREFYRDFQTISAPQGKKTEPNKELVPPQIFEFPMELRLRPTEKEKKKPTPAPAPAAPAAPGEKGK